MKERLSGKESTKKECCMREKGYGEKGYGYMQHMTLT